MYAIRSYYGKPGHPFQCVVSDPGFEIRSERLLEQQSRDQRRQIGISAALPQPVHPGLWNGAMSNWNTLFVEVPIETFNPVKTVNDLLREHVITSYSIHYTKLYEGHSVESSLI